MGSGVLACFYGDYMRVSCNFAIWELLILDVIWRNILICLPTRHMKHRKRGPSPLMNSSQHNPTTPLRLLRPQPANIGMKQKDSNFPLNVRLKQSLRLFSSSLRIHTVSAVAVSFNSVFLRSHSSRTTCLNSARCTP